MSRTYRRKNLPIPWHVKEELVKLGTRSWHWVALDRNSAKYKKNIALHYSDAGSHSFKEPGPAWFRNLFTERPQRREAKRELQKFLNDEEYEVMLLPKNPLEYWT
jgi:hypothetical protein